MSKFSPKPGIPRISGAIPETPLTSQSPEAFIKGAAVITREDSVYPWETTYLQEHPETVRMQSYRLRETLIQKIDYLSKETRIPKAQLIVEGINMVLEKYFSKLGIPFTDK